jgi:hypothetical protein
MHSDTLNLPRIYSCTKRKVYLIKYLSFVVHIAKVVNIHVLSVGREALTNIIVHKRRAVSLRTDVMQKTLMRIYAKNFVFCPKASPCPDEKMNFHFG